MEKYNLVNHFFTVFTPTYNRGYIIQTLFNSLLRQSYKNFEWLIVDNGTKSIEEQVNLFRSKASFPIKYIKTDKKGINRAFNNNVNLADGDLFFKVDDDDYLTDDALAILNTAFNSIKNKHKIAGVSGLRKHENGEIIGGEWVNKSEFVDATNLEREKYGLNGDKAECYYTDVIKENLPFPEYEGENYTDESILYNRIAHKGYKLRWINKAIYCTEYLEDGTTKNLSQKLYENPKTYNYLVNQRIGFDEITRMEKIKLVCRYLEMCRKRKIRKKEAEESLNYSKALFNICWYLSSLTKLFPRKEIK